MKAGTRSCLAAILAVVLGVSSASAQSDSIEVEPERTTAVVAPVETVVRGLPALPRLPYVPTEAPAVSGVVSLPPPQLPPPRLEPIGASIVEAGERVYFSGELGGGVSNAVLGSVNIYRLGAPLQFRFTYEHDQQDGFGFRDPGTGFFHQYNRLESWVAWNDSWRSIEGEARYANRETGLQGLADPEYYSAKTRAMEADVAARVAFSDIFAVRGTVHVADHAQVLTVADVSTAPRIGETRIHPEVAAVLDWPRLRLEFGGAYRARIDANTALESAHAAELNLRAQGIPLMGFTVDGSFAPTFRFGDTAHFPFELGWQLQARNRWTLAARGGLRTAWPAFETFWERYPSFGPDSTVTAQWPTERTWFGEALVEWAALPNRMNVRLSGDVRERYDVATAGSFDAASGRFPLSFVDLTMADTTVELELTPWDRVQVIAGWDAQWMDAEPNTVPHTARLTARLNRERLGMETTVGVPIDSVAVVPMVGAEARYDLAQNVQLGFYIRDALSPAIDNRRTPFGGEADAAYPLVNPGLAAGLTVRVTF